jgi:FkbM family methyltransferase
MYLYLMAMHMELKMKKTLYLADREEDSFQRHCRLSEFLTKDHINIFDVGANVGQSISRYREKFPNCIVTSFEPNPETFTLLEKNWGGVTGVTLSPIALSNYIGQASFYATRVSEASSLLQPTERMIELSSEHKYDHVKIDVATTTLDQYCEINNIGQIDILKIDVQGSELDVLKGAEKLLQTGKITSIYSEITLAETYKNQARFVDIISFLTSNNYEIWDIGSFLYTRNDRLWAANLLLLHTAAASRVEKEYQDKEAGNDPI